MTLDAPSASVPDLTLTEQKLIKIFSDGGSFVKNELSPLALTYTNDEEVRVEARLVREILSGIHGPVGPRGVHLSGVRILGELDLEEVHSRVGLTLTDCAIPEGIYAGGAHIPWLTLDGSRLAELNAPGIRIDKNLSMDFVDVRGDGLDPAIELSRAQIGGRFSISNSSIVNNDGPALRAEMAQFKSGLIVRSSELTGGSVQSAVSLAGSELAYVNIEDCYLRNERGPALLAESISVGSHFSANRSFFRATKHYAASFVLANIKGSLTAYEADVLNDRGPAILAINVEIQGDARFARSRLRGTGEVGAFVMAGASVRGRIDLQDADVANYDGSAVNIEAAQVDQYIFLRRAKLLGWGQDGVVRLLHATVGQSVEFDHATVSNLGGAAIRAHSINVARNFNLRHAKIHCAADRGGIDLMNGSIGEQLEITHTSATNLTGPALFGEGLTVGRPVYLRSSVFYGGGAKSVIWLHGAKLGGLSSEGVTIRSASNRTCNFTNTRIEGVFVFAASVICSRHAGRRPSEDDFCSNPSLVTLDGFSCLDLKADWRQWLHVIRFHMASYRPQPYQHLASLERMYGHENNAREVLIYQQRHLHNEPDGVGGVFSRAVHGLWGALAGYGYRARRTAIALLIALAAAGALGWLAGQIESRPGHLAAERVKSSAIATELQGTPCSTVELVGLGIDRGLPLGVTGLRARCDLDTASTSGQYFTVAIWLIQFCVWGLATLAIAGYTNLIRKAS